MKVGVTRLVLKRCSNGSWPGQRRILGHCLVLTGSGTDPHAQRSPCPAGVGATRASSNKLLTRHSVNNSISVKFPVIWYKPAVAMRLNA